MNLTPVLVGLAVSAVTPLLMRWLMREARNQSGEQTTSGLIMAPSVPEKRGMVIIATLFVVVAVGMFVWSLPFWKIGAMFAVFLALIVVPCLIELRRRVLVSREGIVLHSPWLGERCTRWEQIECVSFGQLGGYHLRFVSSSCRPIRVPCTFSGMAELENLVRQHIAPSKVGAALDQYHAQLEAL